jgi:hypothetical protein
MSEVAFHSLDVIDCLVGKYFWIRFFSDAFELMGALFWDRTGKQVGKRASRVRGASSQENKLGRGQAEIRTPYHWP